MISAQQSQSPLINPSIERVRQRLEGWRKTHRPRSRIPERLWNAAVRLAANHGLNKTARALRLDYYDLKKRLDATVGPAAVGQEPVPSFVELVPASAAACPECLVELESRSGTKLRIHLKGAARPDLAVLGRLFWGDER
jgi:hypothetical protein